ncbi:MAG: hydroxymethylbilane synthase, partial [Syntrophomonadaceae bacterium]|nr:hydroxymethylbilane synthase [Syntrophomonadaceae bacterium]
TYLTTKAERAFLRTLEGGCQVPIAAYAYIRENKLNISGLVASLDGKVVYRSSLVSDKNAAEQLGINLAKELIEQGAFDILHKIKGLGD